MDIDSILDEAKKEYSKATKLHGKFNSAHEGWAVIKEEMDELWDEVRKKKKERSVNDMHKEAIQIAAMALRFITDICIKEENV